VDDYLDHHYLNETTGLESPTSELLAEWLFEKVAASGLPIAAVTIQETCTSECIYRRS
jgi:6-pyruvoyltetrahydropterin/6-carboxytetrahydropterin synthase